MPYSVEKAIMDVSATGTVSHLRSTFSDREFQMQ